VRGFFRSDMMALPIIDDDDSKRCLPPEILLEIEDPFDEFNFLLSQNDLADSIEDLEIHNASLLSKLEHIIFQEVASNVSGIRAPSTGCQDNGRSLQVYHVPPLWWNTDTFTFAIIVPCSLFYCKKNEGRVVL